MHRGFEELLRREIDLIAAQKKDQEKDQEERTGGIEKQQYQETKQEADREENRP